MKMKSGWAFDDIRNRKKLLYGAGTFYFVLCPIMLCVFNVQSSSLVIILVEDD